MKIFESLKIMIKKERERLLRQAGWAFPSVWIRVMSIPDSLHG